MLITYTILGLVVLVNAGILVAAWMKGDDDER